MRLFISITFSNAFIEVIDDIIKIIKPRILRGSYVRRENLHLTLVFVGESDRLEDISRICREAMRKDMLSPVWLRLKGIGKFKSSDGDIIWLGVDDSPALSWYVSRLEDKLISEGFDIQKREFFPHITLVRRVKGFKILKMVIPPVEMKVSKISILRSEVVSGVRVYTEVDKIDLPRRFR